ncbi:MAG TPA: GDP-mannose 4,6-dehydratase, partial [Spirochaetia bacterium]|nr:GDP-mannose 4,6-dehydratase [Spirochaetia bacterium]
GDLSDSGQITNVLYNIRPDEIYHLGAQSHVRTSFDIPEYTGSVTGIGTTSMLDAIRRSGIPARFYQASSSEMFGSASPPQSEATVFHPRSPYAVAKIYAYWMTVNYREAYGMFACNGMMFNHESPRRGETFVTRKITMAVARIKAGKTDALFLGNLEAKRDWGFAPDYVDAMWRMLQQQSPQDLVIGTGETHSVKEFLDESFQYAGLDPARHVRIDERYFRPTEVDVLTADASRARDVLDWKPRVTFRDLVRIMVDADLQAVGVNPPGEGLRVLSRPEYAWLRKP